MLFSIQSYSDDADNNHSTKISSNNDNNIDNNDNNNDNDNNSNKTQLSEEGDITYSFWKL